MTPTQKAAALLGKIKTEKKAAAARANGAKGGRPTRNTIFLVRYKGSVDYCFCATPNHVPAAGQWTASGEISATDAKVMRSMLPAGHARGSSITLMISRFRVLPGEVDILISADYEKGGYGEEIINGVKLKWTTKGCFMGGVYEAPDGQRFGCLSEYLSSLI